jgi:hypothetical protein
VVGVGRLRLPEPADLVKLNELSGVRLQEKDIIVDSRKVDYTSGDSNPVDKVKFFEKHNPTRKFLVKEKLVTWNLPQNFSVGPPSCRLSFPLLPAAPTPLFTLYIHSHPTFTLYSTFTLILHSLSIYIHSTFILILHSLSFYIHSSLYVKCEAALSPKGQVILLEMKSHLLCHLQSWVSTARKPRSKIS